jgi:hypothetical protein
MSDFPPGIGPHEGRELELLLSGDKPVARFRLDGLDQDYEDEFEAAVARGDILRFDFPSAEPAGHRRYYCRRGQEWRVKVMELFLSETQDFTEEDLHRMDGALLGYDQADIDLFIQRLQMRRQSS